MLEKQLPYKYKIYSIIKEDILCGNYAPGDMLNERQLAESLGISRTPVREAIQMLALDGWVQMETYKAAVVREFDLRYLKELSRIRSVLEICAVEDAMAYITDEDIAAMEEILYTQRKELENYNVQEYILMDRKFHAYIYQLSQNQELIHLLQNYYDMFRFLGTQAVMNTDERRYTTLQEHDAILDALRARDAAAAVQAMEFHMKSTEQNLLSRITRPAESGKTK